MADSEFPGSKRIAFIDEARGAAIASMVFVNYPGSSKTIWHPFRHTEWNGWSFADIIFPWFLFIAGLSMVLSLHGAAENRSVRQFATRCAKLYLAGLLTSSLGSGSLTLNPGTLQRIAIGCMLAYPFLRLSLRGQLASIFSIFAIHWLLLAYVRAPQAPWELRWEHGSTFAEYLDLFFGQKPKGLYLSFFGMVECILIGILVGRMGLSCKPIARPTLFSTGAVGLITMGLILSHLPPGSALYIPLIPKLWTPSFILLATGISVLICISFYSATNKKSHENILRPLTVFGVNSFAIYFFLQLVDLVLDYGGHLIGDGSASLRKVAYQSLTLYLPAGIASALTALTMLLLGYLFGRYLFEKRIIVRL